MSQRSKGRSFVCKLIWPIVKSKSGFKIEEWRPRRRSIDWKTEVTTRPSCQLILPPKGSCPILFPVSPTSTWQKMRRRWNGSCPLRAWLATTCPLDGQLSPPIPCHTNYVHPISERSCIFIGVINVVCSIIRCILCNMHTHAQTGSIYWVRVVVGSYFWCIVDVLLSPFSSRSRYMSTDLFLLLL